MNTQTLLCLKVRCACACLEGIKTAISASYLIPNMEKKYVVPPF